MTNAGRGRPRLELTGQRFGRLVVTAPQGVDRARKSLWRCRCDCGEETIAVGVELLRGGVRSCGCISGHREHLYTEAARERNWQREISRVQWFEAKRTREWLAQRGQRGESAA